MSDAVSSDGGVSAEAPAPAAPAESVPEVAAPAPLPAQAGEPAPQVEIEAAPATSEPSTPTPSTPEPEPEIPEVPEPTKPTPEPEPKPEPAAVSSAATTPVPDTSPDKTAVSSASNGASIRSRLGQALEAIRFKKRARLEKILALAREKKSIRNQDVEYMLRVSDTTATNYLNELVVQAKLKRVGSGHQPTYEPL